MRQGQLRDKRMIVGRRNTLLAGCHREKAVMFKTIICHLEHYHRGSRFTELNQAWFLAEPRFDTRQHVVARFIGVADGYENFGETLVLTGLSLRVMQHHAVAREKNLVLARQRCEAGERRCREEKLPERKHRHQQQSQCRAKSFTRHSPVNL
jgi:hypothetical protein